MPLSWRLSSPRGRAREIQIAPGVTWSAEREEKGGFRRLRARIVVAQFQCHASLIFAGCRQAAQELIAVHGWEIFQHIYLQSLYFYI